MKKAEEILREYIEFYDVNGSETVELLPLTIVDIMEEYASQFRKHDVSGSVCDECTDGSGWYGDEDIVYNCSKCNPKAI